MGLISAAINILTKSTNSSSSSDVVSTYIPDIFGKKWTSPSAFRIEKFNRPYVTSVSNSMSYNSPTGIFSFTSSADWKTVLNFHLLSVSIPGIEASPIEVWSAGAWSYTIGRPIVRQLTLTFYDSYNGSTDNSLYKKFLANYWYLNNLYPDEQKWNIQINYVDDFFNNDKLEPMKKFGSVGSTILSTKTAVLSSIGDLKYNQSSKDFMTFDVTFKLYESE